MEREYVMVMVDVLSPLQRKNMRISVSLRNCKDGIQKGMEVEVKVKLEDW